MKNRDKIVALALAGGDPILANMQNPLYSIDEFERVLRSKSYEDYATTISDRFTSGIDLRLVGDLYRAQQALALLKPNDINYPKIMKEYRELLKITSPILEKLQRIRVEVETFDNLELVLEGE